MYRITSDSELGLYSIWSEDGEIVGLVTYYENGLKISVYDSKDRAHIILKEGETWYGFTESKIHKLNLHGKRKIEKMFLGISLQFNIPLPNRITLD